MFTDEYYDDDDDYSNSFEDDCISPSDGKYLSSFLFSYNYFQVLIYFEYYYSNLFN